MTSKYLDKYMNEILLYGGIPTPRWEVIKDLRDKNIPETSINHFMKNLLPSTHLKIQENKYGM